MPKIVYSYDRVTGEYFGTTIARESPEDLKQNKIVWHMPAHATEIAPPAAKAGYATIWDGQKWIQNKLDQITKTIERQLCSFTLPQEIETAFPNIKIKIEGDIDAKTSRTLIFHGIPDTETNQSILDSVLAAHTLPDTKIEKSSKVMLAVVEVMCTEMQKINPSFPDFATFKVKVNELLAKE